MKKNRSNKGMSLIEILIALAVLALIMTAVVSLMSQNTIIFRKTKNDLKVQTQAEDAFAILSNAVMQSKYIYMEGYTDTSDLEFGYGDVGIGTDDSLTAVTAFTTVDPTTPNDSSFAKLKGANPDYPKVYLKKLIVVASAPIDQNVVPLNVPVNPVQVTEAVSGAVLASYEYRTINSTGPNTKYNIGTYQFDDQDAAVKYNSDKKPYFDMSSTPGNHNILVGDTDRVIYTFYFYKDEIYMTQKYLYMNSLNVCADDSLDFIYSGGTLTVDQQLLLDQCKIADCVNYRVSSADSTLAYSGVVGVFNADTNSVEMSLYFNDTHMHFTVDNIIQAKNSFVISESN